MQVLESSVGLKTKLQNMATGVSARVNLGLAAGLFLLALLPRIFGLTIFVTSDEPLWLVRSVLFAEALASGNWAETLQTGHPGVTTMWSGLGGLGLAYWQQGQPGSFLEFLQGISHDPERIDVGLLGWARLPIILLAAVCVALVYSWSRSLVGERVAFTGALLLAFDPLFLAHSRTLHHDALATIFMSLSLLALLNFARTEKATSWGYLVLSGGLAGLAMLSKGTALVMLGVAGLLLGWLWLKRNWSLNQVVLAGVIWFAVAGTTFVALWPAMWVMPRQVGQEVFGWVLASAEGEEEAEAVVGGRVLELGVFFYPVNWLLKSTLLSLVGLIAAVGWWRDPSRREGRWVLGWLLGFALLFGLMLTIGDKRDGRYLLPIYPGLGLVAAAGLVWFLDFISQNLRSEVSSSTPHRVKSLIRARHFSKFALILIFAVSLLAFSLPWYPYYHSYYNPFIGGSWWAPRLVKVGWGEGMEQAAAFLNQQEDAPALVVATSYASTFQPFFKGTTVKHHQVAPSDYVLNYVRQVQNGYPFPEYWDYYAPRPPLFTVRQDGLDYVWLYPGPHINIVRNVEFERGLTLLGFVLDRAAAQPGAVATLTLIWRVPPAETSAGKQTVQVEVRSEDGTVWAEARGPVLDTAGPSPVEGHYALEMPAGIPRGDYEVWVAVVGQIDNLSYKAGILPVRQLDKPVVALPASTNFGDVIIFGGAEVAYPIQDEATAGQRLTVTCLWQARRPIAQSYTTFVHVVDGAGRIWGQADRIPGDGQWPTNQWEKGEWLVDRFQLDLKPETPAGTYTLLAGWYDSQTLERLPVIGENEGQTVVEITSIAVPFTGVSE